MLAPKHQDHSSKAIVTTEGDDGQSSSSNGLALTNKPAPWGTQVASNLGFMNNEGTQLAKGLPKPNPTQSFIER
jgi:hypothetical protein